jgi:hypothetical protein
MLSTNTVAETQFRHDDGQRRKEIALLASIRERRAAASRADSVTTIVSVAPRNTARAAWARPIGVAHAAPEACVA